jgi:hypothetical protein
MAAMAAIWAHFARRRGHFVTKWTRGFPFLVLRPDGAYL